MYILEQGDVLTAQLSICRSQMLIYGKTEVISKKTNYTQRTNINWWEKGGEGGLKRNWWQTNKQIPPIVGFPAMLRIVCPDRIFLPGYFLPYKLKNDSRESEKVL